MTIDLAFRALFPISEQLFKRARAHMPSGISHDIRRLDPFPVYMKSAVGAKKRTVDGVDLIDYGMGHGALMFGHNPPYALDVLDRLRGVSSHFSAGHEAEIEWAERICRMVPSAERVRFTLTGTEATQLAMRLARAATGRDAVLRLPGHYHGWHDYALFGHAAPYDRPSSGGIPETTLDSVKVAAGTDPAAIAEALHATACAALILEPSGPAAGCVPLDAEYLSAVRRMPAPTDTLLIFDEVITGFRWAPGGAQELFGVMPDLTTLGKLVSGGAPGAAVAGRREILDLMSYRGDPDWNRYARVFQNGTWNAYPESAALGAATLDRLITGAVQDSAADMARQLRRGMHDVIRASEFSGGVYGDRSAVRIIVDDEGMLPDVPYDEFIQCVPHARLMRGTAQPLRQTLWKALLVEGTDWLGGDHGWLSAAHTEHDVAQTVDAFERALSRVTRDRQRDVNKNTVIEERAVRD